MQDGRIGARGIDRLGRIPRTVSGDYPFRARPLRFLICRGRQCGLLLPRPRCELRIDDDREPGVRDGPRSRRFRLHGALQLAACEMLQLTLVSRFEHSAELRGRLFRLRSIR